MRKTTLTLGIISLGCDKNRYDTEKLMNSLEDVATFCPPEEANYVFINTCAFLASARQELEEILNELKDKQVILGGCFKKFFTPAFQKRFPQIIAFIDPKTDPNFREKLCNIFNARLNKEAPYGLITTTSPSHAFVKIAEGCNRNCAFCLIPYLTGNYRSRSEMEVLNDIAQRVQIGIREIILVAQDTGLYGLDLKPASSLASLLEKIEHIPGDFWVRVLYLYPETITPALLKVFKNSQRLIPYFDFPIQHTAPNVLKLMGRSANPLKKIKEIQKTLPHAILRTTIMVGFPGESETDFAQLQKDLNEIKFHHLTVFTYSPEPHTPAATLPSQIDPKTKDSREQNILKLSLKHRLSFLKKLSGQTFPAVIDKIENKTAYLRTWHFAPEIDGYILAPAKKENFPGETVLVKINKPDGVNLLGKIL